MRLSASQTRFLCTLCGIFVVGLGVEARAQTTGTLAPAPADISAKDQPSSSKEEPPPGGCMPIGITVSGEVVFPFQCKDFIDSHKATKQSSIAPQDNPDSVPRNAAATQTESVAATPAKAPETVVAPPTTQQAPDAAATTPATEAPETVVTTAASKPSEAVATTPIARTPDTAATTRGAKAPEVIVATPEVKAPETLPPQKPATPLAFKTAVSKTAGDPSTFSKGTPVCAHFRTYDAASHTYVAYGGQRRSCP